MIAIPRVRLVADLMNEREMEIDELVASTGVGRHVIEAMVHQRYTPSPDQRERVSRVLGVERDRIVWGHLSSVEQHIHSPD